jgi:hypothetical protein
MRYYQNDYDSIRRQVEATEMDDKPTSQEPMTLDWVHDKERRPAIASWYRVKHGLSEWFAYRSIQSGGWWVKKKPDGWAMSPEITLWRTLDSMGAMQDTTAIELEPIEP